MRRAACLCSLWFRSSFTLLRVHRTLISGCPFTSHTLSQGQGRTSLGDTPLFPFLRSSLRLSPPRAYWLSLPGVASLIACLISLRYFPRGPYYRHYFQLSPQSLSFFIMSVGPGWPTARSFGSTISSTLSTLTVLLPDYFTSNSWRPHKHSSRSLHSFPPVLHVSDVWPYFITCHPCRFDSTNFHQLSHHFRLEIVQYLPLSRSPSFIFISAFSGTNSAL